MIQVVNGYVCMDCADVALAKKDINPAHPPNDPLQSGSQSGSSNTQSTPAVSLGGVLSQLSTGASVQPPNTASQSASTGTPNGAPAGSTPAAAAPNGPLFALPQQQPYSAGALASLYA